MDGPSPPPTLSEVSTGYEVLIQALHGQTLAVEVASKVLRLERWCEPHYERFMKLRGSAADKLGVRQGEEGRWSMPRESLPAFLELLAPAREERITVPAALKLSMADLAGVRLTPGNLSALLPFVSADAKPAGGSSSGKDPEN